MKKIWKRFEEWATALRSNIFSWARIKLTALYLLIIIATLAVYSTAMFFSLLATSKNEAIEASSQLLRRQILDTAIDHIQRQIFTIDMITFIIAAIGSYWLAGATLKPIRRTLEAQEAFSADASHELRTPLAVMKTDIEVLLRSKEPLSEQVTTVLKSNLEEITVLTTMTGDLLELSRGRQAVREKVTVGALIEQEVGKLQTLAQSKHIALSVKNTAPATLMAAKEALRQVFKNIIANAITYTPDGGTVSIAIQEIEKSIAVTVVDDGIGMSEHDRTNAFKRFYKADNARAGTMSGSGLGLAIAKQIVDQYDGTISIDSTLGKGTTVTITLPRFI